MGLRSFLVSTSIGALALQVAPPIAPTNRPANEKLVRSFVEAFNAHDVPRMLTFVAPDLRWMTVTGDKIGLETSDTKSLSDSMQKYLQRLPSARSELRSVTASGAFVNTVEEARWEANGRPRSQCSVAIYEIADSRIKNVWYFPAHPC